MIGYKVSSFLTLFFLSCKLQEVLCVECKHASSPKNLNCSGRWRYSL